MLESFFRFINTRKGFAIFAVAMLVLAGVAIILLYGLRDSDHRELATLDEILAIDSQRSSDQPDVFLVPYDEPSYMLAATPISVWYKGSDMNSLPMMAVGHNEVTQEDGVSRGVIDFLGVYPHSNVASMGLDDAIISETGGSASWSSNHGLKADTLAAAEKFWDSSDAVVLVEDSPAGYKVGVSAASVASYLNIPVVVTRSVDGSVENTLKDLGVKYSFTCGDIVGYGKVWPFEDTWDVLNLLALGTLTSDPRTILNDRVGISPSYIALANPMDAFRPVVVESFSETFTGEVESQPSGSTSFPSMDKNSPVHYITIPEEYTYANVRIESIIDFSSPIVGGDPDLEGQRSYTYFGIDGNKDGNMVEGPDDKIHFFVPSLAYENIRDGGGNAVQGYGYTEQPIYHSTGEKMVSIVATLHDMGETSDTFLPTPTTTYSITVTVEKLDGPNYPMMFCLSGLASYLAAFRGGLVLAQEDFGIHSRGLQDLPDSGNPSQNEDMVEENNKQVFYVKNRLNTLLAQLADVEDDPVSVASAYESSNQTMFVGIVADTNMIPQYLFPTSGQIYFPWQGYGVAGDGGYADIDMDLYGAPYSVDDEMPSMELAVGRIVGWDAQDASALLARTFFYSSIIDEFPGLAGRTWKESALTTFGTGPPVGLALTVTQKLTAAFRQAGFYVDSSCNAHLSDSKITAPLYSRSNFIYFCAHGFYYWYVPPGFKPTGVGGGFDVAHVKDMSFGPSVIFGSSCVTGKIDGIQPYNALSLAFLHSGMNSYIGASRLSWGGLSLIENSGEAYGDYLALLMYGYLTGFIYDKDGGLMSQTEGDVTMGEALMMAKNMFLSMEGTDGGGPRDDTIAEFNIHGDPAFNPYEPIHQG